MEQPHQPSQPYMAPAGKESTTASHAPGKMFVDSPKWIYILRLLQLIFANTVLVISAQGMQSRVSPEGQFMLAVAILTFLILGYRVLTKKEGSLRRFYSVWAALATEIFLVVMWLAALALMADVRKRSRPGDTDTFGSCTISNGPEFNAVKGCRCPRSVQLTKGGQSVCLNEIAKRSYLAMAILSAFEFLFFGVTASITALRLFHHRRTHANNQASATPATP